jgi:phospholipid/cholesterol/gamma-HCH transport system substrate-binding protein
MPRTRSLAWSELKIGVLTIVALVIAVMTIFLLTGSRGLPWQRYNLKTRFDNVAGLKPGSPVRVAGVDVGTVTAIEFAGDLVDIWMEINVSMRQRITSASVASLGSVSLLGESAVDITPATRGAALADWAYVPSGPGVGQLSDVAETATRTVEQVTALVSDLREGRGTLGQLITDEGVYRELERFLTSAGSLTESLRDGRGTLGQLLNDPAVAAALQASLTNVDAITSRIKAGEGSLGRLMQDDGFARSLTAASANLEALAGRLNQGQGTIGKLMTDEAVFNRLDSLTTRLDELVTSLNAGEGTAGQLLKDQQLYENMNAAVSDVRSLIADIRQDPRKFLNVRVSIF